MKKGIFLLSFFWLIGITTSFSQEFLQLTYPSDYSGPFTLEAKIVNPPAGARYGVSFNTLINCTVSPIGGSLQSTNSWTRNFTVTPAPANAPNVSGNVTADRVGSSADLFGAFNASSILPVELSAFSAHSEAGKVILSWSTVSESNNEMFYIEHSVDGDRFETIGKVLGAGTSIREREYSFEHKIPEPGINYYRLRQVDFDGTSQFSEIESVQFNKNRRLQLQPTAADISTELSFSEELPEGALLEVFSLSGQKISEAVLEKGTTSYILDVHNFPAGQYLLRLTAGADISVERFQKM